MTNQIREKIKNFIAQKAEGPIFWYDPSGMLGDFLKESISDIIQIREFNGSYLQLRKWIELEPKNLKQKSLIYIPEKPLIQSWILDLEIIGIKLNITLADLISQTFSVSLQPQVINLLNSKIGYELIKNWDQFFEKKKKMTSDVILNAIFQFIFNLSDKYEFKKAIISLLKEPNHIIDDLMNYELLDLFKTELWNNGLLCKEITSQNIVNSIKYTIISSRIPHEIASIEFQKGFKEIIPSQGPWISIWKELKENFGSYALLKEMTREFEDLFDIKSKMLVFNNEELSKIEIFPCIDEILMNRFEETFISQVDSKKIEFPLVFQSIYEKRKKMVWMINQSENNWEILNKLTILDQAINQATDECQIKSVSIGSYCESFLAENGWWNLDQEFEDLKDMDLFNIPNWIKDNLLSVIRNKYYRWMENINKKWSELIESNQKWPFSIITPEKIRDKYIIPSEKKIVVLFLDAFRAQIMKLIKKELQSSNSWKCEEIPMLSALPSSTEFGMLLPLTKLTNPVTIMIEKGKILFNDAQEASSYNFDIKSERLKFLTKSLSLELLNFIFFDFTDLYSQNLSGLEEKIKNYDYIFIFYRDLDEHGNLLIKSPADLKNTHIRAITILLNRLSQLNIDQVLLIPDHGYISNFIDFQNEKIEIPVKSDKIIKKMRYLIGDPREIPNNSNVISLKLNNFGFNSSLEMIYPIGLNYFNIQGEQPPFIHGGLSLQENCLILLDLSKKQSKIKKYLPIKIRIEFPEIITTKRVKFRILCEKSPKGATPRKIIILAKDFETEDQIGTSEIKEIVYTFSGIAIDVYLSLSQLPKKVHFIVKDIFTDEILSEKECKVELTGYDDLI